MSNKELIGHAENAAIRAFLKHPLSGCVYKTINLAHDPFTHLQSFGHKMHNSRTDPRRLANTRSIHLPRIVIDDVVKRGREVPMPSNR